MKRQHRSTLDRCRIYLEKRIEMYFGFTSAITREDLFEPCCDEVAENMRGDLTFDNWMVACDVTYPI